MDPYAEFEEAFVPLLEGALDMFVQESQAMKDEHGNSITDVDKIQQAEQTLKARRKQCRDIVDSARDDLKGARVGCCWAREREEGRRADGFEAGGWLGTALSRKYEQQRASATRAPGLPSAAEHEARMQQATADRIKRGKQNNELEQTLYRHQAELERLQQELKEEEADAFEISELNSEV